MTPPGPHAMTAQAGAVAACPFCGEPLKTVSVSEGSTFRWRKVDGCCADGPEVRHDTTADDQAAAELESTRKAIAAWNERPAPPAAVPVEALEGLVAELMARVEADKPQCTNDDGSYRSDAHRAAWNFADGLEHAADKVYELIKERSNG